MKSYALIANPASGRGLAMRQAEALKKAMAGSASVQILRTTHRGAAIKMAAECVGYADRVIAVGGDGTLNEVASGLMSVRGGVPGLPELGYLPAGTANAARRAFGLDSDPRAVAQSLAHVRSVGLDVGLVRHSGGDRAFLLWIGAGWDAVVINALNSERTGLMGVSGMLGHAPRVVRSLAGYDQPPITTDVDGSPWGTHASVVVANVGDIAFGGRVAAGVDPYDGRLDVVGVPPLSLPRSLRLGFLMMKSHLARSSEIKRSVATRVELRSKAEVPFQIDGEPVGVLPATIRVVPGALQFLKT